MEQPLDLTFLVKSMLQSVPIWAALAFLVNRYLKKTEKQEAEIEARLSRMEDHLKNIDLTLAAANLHQVTEIVETLRTQQHHFEIELKDLWRIAQKRVGASRKDL